MDNRQHNSIKSVCRIGSSGQTKLGVLITVLLVAATAFAGSRIFPFFYYYYELKGYCESQAMLASQFSDEKLRKDILKKMHFLQIPANDDDLKINRFNGQIEISLPYNEVFYVDFGEDRVYDLYVFDFDIHVLKTF